MRAALGLLGLTSLLAVVPAPAPAHAGNASSPAAGSTFTISVKAKVSITHVSASSSRVKIEGSLHPEAPNRDARVDVLARPSGSERKYRVVGERSLKPGASHYTVTGFVHHGTWQVKVRYADPGLLRTGTSTTKTVKVHG